MGMAVLMPINYAPDWMRQRLLLTAQDGDVELDDLLVALVPRAQEGAWQFDVVYDVRQCRRPLSADEVSLLTLRVRDLSSTRGSSAPMAIVTAETAVGWIEVLSSQLAESGQLTA